jgi:hypothetical protein
MIERDSYRGCVTYQLDCSIGKKFFVEGLHVVTRPSVKTFIAEGSGDVGGR